MGEVVDCATKLPERAIVARAPIATEETAVPDPVNKVIFIEVL